MQTAWNRADGAAYGKQFADTADFIDIRGTLHQGRRAIAAGHQAIFDTIYKGSVLTHRALDARALGNGVIIAHGEATMWTPSGMLDGRRAINTLVLVQRGSAWQIETFHNALADAT